MERFYLHIQKFESTFADLEGEEHPSLEAAREEAVEAAREILAGALKAGREVDTEAIVVADEQGRELARVALKDVLPAPLLSDSRT